jgi:hypothetical protein
VLRRAILALLVIAAVAQPAAAASAGDAPRLHGPNGVPLFVSGINYEGPADRAWQMWDQGKFDASAIDGDFGRAAGAGFNVVRLFVQASLAADLGAGHWDKLDQVVGLAEKHGLQLELSLHDYGERDLAKVSATAAQVAKRYRDRAGLLLLDLKNEPRFNDLALTKYATTTPLQQRGLIDTFGERLARSDVPSYRASDDGTRTVPPYLSDDDAWIYVNNLRLYREMLSAASDWVKANGYKSTTLDYLDDQAGQQWAPLTDALNATLAAWLGPQVQAIRAADPSRKITVDHVDAVMARLPANDVLDVQSLHRYPSTTASSIKANLNLIASLENAHPDQPYLWSEFGYATDSLDPDQAAVAETAIYLGLLSQGAAGGAKWMLNDMPPGFNQRERTLGAFSVDGSPKPVVAGLAALRDYLNVTGASPGTLKLEDDPTGGIRFVYRAADALFVGGKSVDGGGLSFDADKPAELFASWSEPGVIRLWATTPMSIKLDPAALLGDKTTRPVALTLQPGLFQLKNAAPRQNAADYDIANGHFFSQTNGRKESLSGFSVTDADGVPFWSAFQSLGGVDVLGYPVTRRFTLDGFTVQAFQKAVLQWRPERQMFDFLNTFDVLHDRGLDGWLETARQTPPPQDTAPDAGLSWDQVVARHLALLDKAPPALKDRFLTDERWLDHYGLPVAIQEFPNSIVVRAQRATLQYWKEAVPWAAKGSVSVANGGDLAKEAGLFPWLSVTPDNAPH